MVRARILVPISLVLAVAAGGVAGAVMGVPALSGAAETTTTPKPATAPFPGSFAAHTGSPELQAAAQALGLTVQQLRTDLSDGKTTIADIAKQRGVDLNKVIDAMTNADRQRIQKIVNSPWPNMPSLPPGLGPNVGGPGALGRFGPRLGFRLGGPAAMSAAANALGITTQQLATDLRNGQTIAQIATANHVDVNAVINAMVTQTDSTIDHAQSNGTITAAQANAAKTKVKEAITHLVQNGLPRFGSGGFKFKSGAGPGGYFGGPVMPKSPNQA
jgi:hypothetical protein